MWDGSPTIKEYEHPEAQVDAAAAPKNLKKSLREIFAIVNTKRKFIEYVRNYIVFIPLILLLKVKNRPRRAGLWGVMVNLKEG
jgi:hypothetical protein